ncbi:hypothetical protein HETIRDRAFT_430387 [Heterobasidion irregulare TC 32-1]|uniref:Uncharacterized protein n=1 Tax=Heterobasidion irregulare (strain TC 32-1) TaxID=747525 RepID=W4JQV1_HETIT|nr:uncharacterized protein HETIRDRAFT_430387 [Heterobasidion irregulare TC 32-1]ETW75913.1 hypothetical protein HETIRDRAFT_430387 [Heterobasidion irregulare TC 32-1]
MTRSSARFPPEAKQHRSRDNITWTCAMHARRSSDYGMLEGPRILQRWRDVGEGTGHATVKPSHGQAPGQRRGIGGRLGPVVFYTTCCAVLYCRSGDACAAMRRRRRPVGYSWYRTRNASRGEARRDARVSKSRRRAHRAYKPRTGLRASCTVAFPCSARRRRALAALCCAWTASDGLLYLQ